MKTSSLTLSSCLLLAALVLNGCAAEDPTSNDIDPMTVDDPVVNTPPVNTPPEDIVTPTTTPTHESSNYSNFGEKMDHVWTLKSINGTSTPSDPMSVRCLTGTNTMQVCDRGALVTLEGPTDCVMYDLPALLPDVSEDDPLIILHDGGSKSTWYRVKDSLFWVGKLPGHPHDIVHEYHNPQPLPAQ